MCLNLTNTFRFIWVVSRVLKLTFFSKETENHVENISKMRKFPVTVYEGTNVLIL